jgi:hypothetical protein
MGEGYAPYYYKTLIAHLRASYKNLRRAWQVALFGKQSQLSIIFSPKRGSIKPKFLEYFAEFPIYS